MAWKIEQVEKFKKGLDDSEKKKWVRKANKVLKDELAKGTPIREAEIIAVRAANAMFSEDELIGLTFAEMKEVEELRLAEVGDPDDEWQLVIPVGTTYSNWYGEIILTEGFFEDMVANQPVLKKTRPFLNEQHDRGRALAWMSDMRVTSEGLEVKWAFNKLGKELLEDEVYKYYSGEIQEVRDIDTGEYVYPVFGGAALTNSPVMKGMPEAHLSENKPNKAEGPKTKESSKMNFEELMEAVKNLSDSQKKELVRSLGFEDRSGEITTLTERVTGLDEVNKDLKEKNKQLSDKVAEFEKSKIDTFLSDAIAAGKIKPADKDKWNERLEKDFDFFSKTIDDLPKVIDLTGPKGSSQDNDEESGATFAERRNEFTATRRRRGKKNVKENSDGADE